jgi:DNA-directed RNA polymerase subunit beta'
MMREGEPGEGMASSRHGEIEHALHSKAVTLHTKIKARYSDRREGKPCPSAGSRPRPGRMMLGRAAAEASRRCRSTSSTS